MSEDFFTVSVPDEQLEAPVFELIPTGAYRTTLQAGAELMEREGWKRVRLPFRGFAALKEGAKSFEGRGMDARFPVEAPTGASDGQAKAVQIGRAKVIGAAAALGLTEPVTGADGKPAQKLVAQSYEELVEQFNAMAGTDVEAYVTLKPRVRNGVAVQRTDGTGPVMDNEIANVRALKG